MASAHTFQKLFENIYILFDVTRPSEECDTGRRKIKSPIVISGLDFIVRRKEGQAIEKIPGSYAAFCLGNNKKSRKNQKDDFFLEEDCV